MLKLLDQTTESHGGSPIDIPISPYWMGRENHCQVLPFRESRPDSVDGGIINGEDYWEVADD
jgi:hypothetical protein